MNDTTSEINCQIETLLLRALKEIGEKDIISTSDLKNVVSAFRTWQKDDNENSEQVVIIDNIASL